MMERKDFVKGQRVKIHPACDWWMRGAKFGTITSRPVMHAFVKLEIGGESLSHPPVRIKWDLLTDADSTF